MKLLLRTLIFLLILGGISFSQTQQDSLIVYYPFNGNANDESNNHLDGTVFGGQITKDRFNIDSSAYSFNGIDNYINLGNNQLLKPDFPISISVWINKRNDEQGWIFGNNLNQDNYMGIFLGFGDNNIISLHFGNGLQVGTLSARRSIYATDPIELNKWYHIVGTIESPENMQLYLNGEKINTVYSGTATELVYDEGIAVLGKYHNWQYQNARYFNGVIDEFKFYNRLLNYEEILNLYVPVSIIAETTMGMTPLEIHFTGVPTSSNFNYKWEWDFDNDGVIDSEEQNPVWVYYDHGIYTVKLTISDSISSKIIIEKDFIAALSESPFITSINDIQNDQGGKVEIQFAKSYYDNDSLVLSKSMSPEFYTIEYSAETKWIAVGSTVAYGKTIYDVLVPTIKDSTIDSDGLISFRVIAGMEEGNFVSEEVVGYSVDNISPSIPSSLISKINDDEVELLWDDIYDLDFRHYNIYRNSENHFDSNSQPLSQVYKPQYIDVQLDSGTTYYYCIKSVDNSGNQSGFSNVSSVLLTSVLNDQNEIPNSYSLSQNYPNPFNPTTTIAYSLPNSSTVLLKVYDMLGNEVVNLVNDHKNAGKHKIKFNGNSLASGIYYYTLSAGSYFQSRKFILLK